MFGFLGTIFTQPLTFVAVAYREDHEKQKPDQDFYNALDFIQDHLATVSYVPFWEKVDCPYCGRSELGKGYRTQYSYKGWRWTGAQRHHVMFAHVQNGDGAHGYYVPHPDFAYMVTAAYPYSNPAANLATKVA